VGELRGSDLTTVREQLGREPTTPFTVVARCPEGHPLVIRNHPVDAEGHPFPTLFWLTCPAAVKAVSRLESEGAIARLNQRAEHDAAFAEELAAAHAAYAAERAREVAQAREHGGVGGTRTGVKCLHAHYAHHLAGGDDPVGAWVAAEVEPVHEERPGRVAAIDQGTNSIRLLVVEPREDGPRELSRDMVITRLGRGVDETGRISPDALRRTVDVLATFCRRARALHAERIHVGATSAVRDATNRGAYEDAVLEHAGAPLTVISGEHEAALSFRGATSGLAVDGAEPPYLVQDIGGGSTEYVVGAAEPQAAISTQMGSVRLTERFLTTDPPSAPELEAMAAAIEIVLDGVEAAVPVDRARTFVAVAGTATTVQALALGLPFYDPERIHRTWLALADVERVLADLAAMTNAERAALPVMAPGRGDVIVAGALVLARSMRRFGFDRVLVSETDILDGLALEALGPPGTTTPAAPADRPRPTE
jgi:exopolyphosphatase/guanosine-5'-triphosphate,3'-diphosphate pyrophosphatase